MGIEVQHEPGESGFKTSIVEDGTPVARLVVGRYTMHVAGVGVTMGGIADVVTHPQHRGRGYGARLLRAAVDRMREERYPISLLFGISDFYHRFGYAPVRPEYAVYVATRHAERFCQSTQAAQGLVASAPGAAITVRPGRADDAPALLALYTRVNEGRTGTLRRDAAKLDATPRVEGDNWWPHPRRYLVAECDGQPAGYVILSGNPAQFRIMEVVVPAEHVVPAGTALLAALADEAAARRLETIRLPLPPDEPLVDLLRQAGCKIEITYPANGEGMGRIVDLAALTAALRPTQAARAESLPVSVRPGTLEITCPASGDEAEMRASVSLGAGRTVRLTLPQQQLCQLVMGYRSLDAIRLQHPEACAAEESAALDALFPAGYPHMWGIDHF